MRPTHRPMPAPRGIVPRTRAAASRAARLLQHPVSGSGGAYGDDVDWVEHAVWWQVYPLGFVGAADESPAGAPLDNHRLRRLVDWLDYARDLGANGLALG